VREAALLALYAVNPGCAVIAEIEPKLTIVPLPFFFMCSTAYLLHSAVPTTLIASDRCHSSTVASSPLKIKTAALFTKMCMVPKAWTAKQFASHRSLWKRRRLQPEHQQNFLDQRHSFLDCIAIDVHDYNFCTFLGKSHRRCPSYA